MKAIKMLAILTMVMVVGLGLCSVASACWCPCDPHPYNGPMLKKNCYDEPVVVMYAHGYPVNTYQWKPLHYFDMPSLKNC